MNKAIFLDRDGTINIDYGYVHEINNFYFIDGVIDGLKILSDLGYLLIIITNQSGIGRGYFSEKELENLNSYMKRKLNDENITINGIYYCPHVDSDNCNCRKPKLELFYKAQQEFNIDFENSYAIGDKKRDLEICKKEKVTGILLTNENDEEFICKKNLLEAANYISKKGVTK